MKFNSLMIGLLAVQISGMAFSQEADLKVKIAENLPYLETTHNGEKVRVQRIQDQGHKLIDDFAKTSRPCPPFCIHPIKAAPGVETYGELELLDFVDKQGKAGTGILIDARMPEFYRVETIPSAVNIPFSVIKPENPHIDRILNVLGARKVGSSWNFNEARTLVLFCNGVWCDQSPRAIKSLMALGYPADKLKYYRGGLQLWRMLGLTTVVPTKPM
jgi:rhodanese-related sulfurtransferase